MRCVLAWRWFYPGSVVVGLFNELMQRKALIVAAFLFALGAGLIGQTALERLTPQGTQPGLNEPTAGFIDDTFAEDIADQDKSERTATPTKVAFIVAYVSGAVRAPDVYQLPAGARVKDLVLAAGGLSDDADIERINLAAPISDGQHVRVPWIGDGATVAEATPDESGADAGSGGLLDLNRATAAESMHCQALARCWQIGLLNGANVRDRFNPSMIWARWKASVLHCWQNWRRS